MCNKLLPALVKVTMQKPVYHYSCIYLTLGAVKVTVVCMCFCSWVLNYLTHGFP